jgi:UDP-glucose:(heptosyl)LPS alpha-1,3-glucosyltransferase
MRLAFCLFKYFPFGGMQRNFLRIAEACLKRGHQVHVFTLNWQGDRPQGLNVTVLPMRGFFSHQRGASFAERVAPLLTEGGYDAVVGFNRMPGLDVYYAADLCFQARAVNQRGRLYRLTSRYRQFVALERAVFAPQAGTEILLLSETEKANFMRYYGTPETRFHLLPPEIASDHFASNDNPLIRIALRAEFKIAEQDKLVMLIGSGFRTKGLDRALLALAGMPQGLKERVKLIAIGQDNPRPFFRLARRLGISRQVRILPGRDDIPRFLQGADLLIHPAYAENTGTVLIEAMAAGLPVLTTDVCGYAVHVSRAGAGCVLPSPFDQRELDSRLVEMLTSEVRDSWREKGMRYARSLSTRSRAEVAADVIEAKAREKAGAKTLREAAVARVE